MRLTPLVLLLLAATPAAAATIHVPGDHPTIQAGIDAASVGDEVLVAPGTYSGPGNTNLELRGKNIAVRASGGPHVTIIDGEDINRGFYINDGETRAAVIDGFTIQHGFAFQSPGGGIYALTSSPTVMNCILTLNRARDGAGFACQNQSGPLVRDCTFINNDGSSGGGLWYGFGTTTITIERCRFLNNIASGIGSIGGGILGDGGTAIISDCTFVSNKASEGGGMALASTSATVIRCTIAGNQAIFSGGGIMLAQGSPQCSLDLRNSIVAFNNSHAITCGGSLNIVCTDIFGNGGDWVGCLAGFFGQNGNIRLDPLFCSPQNYDYTLNAASPCAAGNAGACGQIGAWPVGCGVTPVDPSTWGQIKHRLME